MSTRQPGTCCASLPPSEHHLSHLEALFGMLVPHWVMAMMMGRPAVQEPRGMQTSLAQLEALVGVAIHHAAEVHGATIASTVSDLSRIDRLLEVESAQSDPSRFATLAACYGTWFGALAVRELHARWIALDEPVAPRVQVGHLVFSPIDAVTRRLSAPGTSPSLSELFAKLSASVSAGSPPAREALLSQNRAAWTALANHPRFAGPLTLPPDARSATAALDPWLREDGVHDKAVLCLGAGGGRHGPLLARAGARVTVVDISEAQLDHDRRAAGSAGLTLQTICASLDDLHELDEASCDVVVQPVSACYLPDLSRMHQEIARVLRPGGLYLAQHKQPASTQAEAQPTDGGYLVRVRSSEHAPLPDRVGVAHREPGTAEYLHTLETLVGGLCRAGFVVCDLQEPVIADAFAPSASAEHRALYLPPYLKIKARRARAG